MHAYLARARRLLASPTLRPVEIWIMRAIFVYVMAKLGVSADHLAK